MADKNNQEPQFEDKEQEPSPKNTSNLMAGENEGDAGRRDTAANGKHSNEQEAKGSTEMAADCVFRASVGDECDTENAAKANVANPTADAADEEAASQQSAVGSSKPTKKSAKDYMPEEKWTKAHQVWAQALLALPDQEKTDSLRNEAKRMEGEPDGGGFVDDKHP